MPLTPDEEKKLREQVREELKDREKRLGDLQQKEQSSRQQKLEDRLRRQIEEEEEEKYFTDRGYVKYTNRHGGVEWLTPDEEQKRMSRRRSRTTSSRSKIRKKGQRIQYAINLAMVIFALAVFGYLWRYNPNAAPPKSANIVIETDVPGAQIFLNGGEKHQVFTPDTLAGLAPGAHFVTVYKEGYSVWPPMQRISLAGDETMVVEFQLKTSGQMGQLSIGSNLTEFDIYVDGIAIPEEPGQVLNIPAGYHVISAIKEGYTASPQHQKILIKEGALTRLSFYFEKNDDLGYLKVSSNVSSAYIFIDNQLTGIKPNGKGIPIKPGVYEIRVCENGYASLPQTELIRIHSGKTRILSFSLQKAALDDTIHVATTMPGAGIIVDGQWQRLVTPANKFLLSKGDHFVNFMRDTKIYQEKEVRVMTARLHDHRLVIDF